MTVTNDAKATAWTPGTWRAWQAPDEMWVVRTTYEEGGYRKTAFPAVVNCGSQPNEANAHLMASAPDLYAALETVLSVRMLDNLTSEQHASIMAAMAKARGES